MKKTYLAILFFVFCCSIAFSSPISVNTGFGYYKKDGKIVEKAVLAPGVHNLSEGYEYVELRSKEELDSVEVYVPPPTSEQIEAKKNVELDEIDRKSIRSLRAILSAQAEGKTPEQTDLNTLKALEAQAKTIRGRK